MNYFLAFDSVRPAYRTTLPMALEDTVGRTLGAAFFTFVFGCVYVLVVCLSRTITDSPSWSPRLYGITLSQVYQYFKMYPGDTRILKSTVSFRCYLGALHLIISVQYIGCSDLVGSMPDSTLDVRRNLTR